jgi:hypothetical protein
MPPCAKTPWSSKRSRSGRPAQAGDEPSGAPFEAALQARLGDPLVGADKAEAGREPDRVRTRGRRDAGEGESEQTGRAGEAGHDAASGPGG